jgi:catechol 2,3-dioxygenase-like lactoylglutathione lyase family enzyme
MGGWVLDHVVLVVDDLDRAVARFQSLGFTPTPGGVNGPTHNALIAFSDGTYVELIALRSRWARRLLRLMNALGGLAIRRALRADLNNRLLGWLGGPVGFRDLCFRVADLSSFRRRSSEEGAPLTPLVRFRRDRPDGVGVHWLLAGAMDLSQPFFIEDVTPIRDRIPEGLAREHANGASGIVGVATRKAITGECDDVELTTLPGLRAGQIALTLSTRAPDPPDLPASACCGALIRFRVERDLAP